MANSTPKNQYHLAVDNRIIHEEAIAGGKSGRPLIIPRIYNQIVMYSDFSDADTSEVLDLNATFTNNLFPANVEILAAWLQLYEGFDGPSCSAATLILGDAAATSELVGSTNVFEGQTLAVKLGLNLNTQEAAYVPLLQLDTTACNINALTAGIVGVFVKWQEIPTIPQGTVRD